MSPRLATSEGLKVGDVVALSTPYRDRRTGDQRWWERFAVVMREPTTKHYVDLARLTFDMEDLDERTIDLDTAVVKLLHPDEYPQGVSAMLMKAIAKKQIVLP